MTAIDWLFSPFALPFMQRPLLVMLVLAVALGLASVMVTLRSLQFVGDGQATVDRRRGGSPIFVQF